MCQTKCNGTVGDCERRNAKIFLEILSEEGSKIRCDGSSENFRNGMDLPTFYDKEKFERGQNFFHENIFAMFYAKLLGLMADLSLSSSQKILEYTNQSSEPITAYRRYASTIYSMYCWYSHDLTPGSMSWQSLKRVRSIHNFASLKSHYDRIDEITQYHMALAQFGFMGLVVARSEKIGIHNPKREDMEAFVHFWRVIGHMLGIQERYNICRSSFQETKDICEQIIEEVMAPAMSEWHPSFLKMAQALIDGMWAMMPILQFKVWLNLLYRLLNENNNNEDVKILKMGFWEKCVFEIVSFTIYSLRFVSFRIFMKYHMRLILFLTQKFPFLAYYKYGLNYRHTKFVENTKISYCITAKCD